MAKSQYIQTSFLSGELSPLVKGNIDIAQYYQGVQTASNVLVVPQGGLKRRGGLEFIALNRPYLSRKTGASVTMPNGGSTTNINDDDDSTFSTTTTGISTTSPYIVAEYDFGGGFSFEFADIRRVQLSIVGSPAYENHVFKIQYSDDAVSWSDSASGTFGAVDPAVVFDKRVSLVSDGNHRYWRLVLTGAVDLTTSVVVLGGLDFIQDAGTGYSARKLFEFNTSTTDRFLIVVTQGNIAVYRVNTTVTIQGNLKYNYLDADIHDIRHATTENVCLLFHEDYPTQRIIFNNNADGFRLSDTPFSNVPQFDFNDDNSPTPVSDVQVATFNTFSTGQTYQVDVEGVLSKQITFAGDSTVDEQQATEFNLQKNLQDMPTFGETGVNVTRTGANQYTITVSGESAKDFQLYSAFATSGSTSSTITFTKSANGSPRKEDVWSSTRGYPRMGAFFEGRLWLGGTRDKKQSLFASKAGSLLDFKIGEGADDEAIFTTIVSRSLTEITDIYPGRNLQVFTAGAEYAVLDSGITPSAINLRTQTSNGSLYIAAEESDGAVIFADRNGKTLREFTYTFNEDSYTATDISVLSSHLIKKPVDMAFLNGTASDDANWLFIINEDGTASVLNKLRSQDINAFTSFSLATPFSVQSKIEAVEVVDDQAFFAVQRYDSGGNLISTIERFSFDYLMDGSVKGAATGSVLPGLDHLVGFEVSVVGDGSVLDSRTVDSSGEITLTATELSTHSVFEAGINFTPQIIPMPLNTNIGSGQNFMGLKRIVRMNLRINESFGLYIDDVPVPFRSFGENVLDDPPNTYTGILGDIYPTEGWNRDVMPVFSAPDPTPMHIQAIDFKVESS